ncbi:hypothetical protein CSKR_112620 [Clonorchis sinensis]|uniref:Uncharacterized protein n=1 Tax=Clonorchis sinensis TaxID=79923 RepID=A0A3R7G840_CLOSI|nr:hypothetical protein CSKR_112620 [Clonorchis sinensis]
MPPEGSTRAGILSGCPSLDKASRERGVGFEPRTFHYRPVATLEKLMISQWLWGETVQWLEREFTDRKVRGSNPTYASRLPMSTTVQPGSIPVLVLPLGGMAARHRKGVTAGRLSFCILMVTMSHRKLSRTTVTFEIPVGETARQ